MISCILGPVSSGKTVELIIRAHQLSTIHGKHVKILKPAFDTRYKREVIKSASGLEIEITDLIDKEVDIRNINMENVKFIVLDEVQFFTVKQIYQLKEISEKKSIDIYAYGLMKDFRNKIFEATSAIMEFADKISFKTTFCVLCTPNKACENAHISMKIYKDENGKLIPTTEGNKFCIGGIESFVPVCSSCYKNAIEEPEMNSINVDLY